MPKTSRPGRPGRLTDDLQEQIVNLVKRGVYAATAAAACGVAETTFYRWMQAGEDHNEVRDGQSKFVRATSPYREFREAIQTARAQAEVMHLENIRAAAFDTAQGPDGKLKITPKNWPASAWFLERTAPERYGRQVIEHQGKNGGPIQTEHKVKVVRFGGRHRPDGTTTNGKEIE